MSSLVTVLAPSFLWMLPLAGLPIAFHLLMRRRQRRVVFSTLMFFHHVDPRLSSRRKIRERLLLAARVALIALMFAGLSRPVARLFGGIAGLSGGQAVELLVDNSASMRADAAGVDRSKLDVAVAAARSMVVATTAGTPVAISTTVVDPKSGFSTTANTEREQALAQLDGILPTDAAGRPAAALAAAVDRLERSGQSTGTVHVFSDLQAEEWSQEAVVKAGGAGRTQVIFHRIATEPSQAGDVAFVSAGVRTRRPLAAQPVLFRAALANAGAAPTRVQVSTEDDAGLTTSRWVELAAGGRDFVDVSFEPKSAGVHWIRCWIEGDAFPGNNASAAAFVVSDRATVCFVGELAGYGSLPIAVAPTADAGATSLVAESVAAARLPDALAKAPVAVAITWQELSRLPDGGRLLGDYVTDGGRLCVVPDAREPKAVLPTRDRLPPWVLSACGPIGEVTVVSEAKTLGGPQEPRLDPRNPESPFWSRLRTGGKLSWSTIRVRRCGVFEAPAVGADGGREADAEPKPVAALEDDRPVLMHWRHAQGSITASGFAFDPAWTTLTSAPHFVVLSQSMMLGADDAESSGIEIEAGDLPSPLIVGAESVAIVPVVGDVVPWSGPPGQMPNVPRAAAGIIRSEFAAEDGKTVRKNREWTFSTRGSMSEGKENFLETGKVPAAAGIAHVVSTVSPSDPAAVARSATRGATDLYMPAVLLAIAALVAEGLLAAPRPPGEAARAGRRRSQEAAA